ncbi:MAG: hypothetical protein NVSMB17_03910 [Candidatus Dormibacteria bacterium]
MRVITNNWRLKLAAVFIASSTWGVVAYAGNPVVTRVVPRVAIQSGPLPNNNWVIVSQLSPPAVTLSGLQQAVGAYDPKNLHALVDFSRARLGLNQLRVQVDTGDPAVTVTQIVPDHVSVVLDERDIVTKKVNVIPRNSQNSCCAAQVSKATADPDTVKLSGPKSLLARAEPYVEVDLTEARTTIKLEQVTVRLQGVPTRSVSLLTVEPAAVGVTVPITVVHKAIQAFVVVAEQGQVASGFELGPISVNPSIVTLEGDPNLVGPITSVDTELINLNGATGDIVRTVGLRPPQGVTVVGASTVTVRIRVTPVVAPTPSPSPSPTLAPSPSPSPSR